MSVEVLAIIGHNNSYKAVTLYEYRFLLSCYLCMTAYFLHDDSAHTTYLDRMICFFEFILLNF